MGLFDMPGGQFLVLYVALLAVAIGAGFILPRLLRPAGRPMPLNDPEQVAYLAGGKLRFAETIVSRLLAADAVRMKGGKLTVLSPSAGQSTAERRLLAQPSPISWADASNALAPEVDATERRLVQSGLMFDASPGMRLLQTAPYLALLAFGAIKVLVGLSRGKPVGFLIGLLVVTAILALIRFAAVDRRTRAGIDVLKTAQKQSDRMRRAPVEGETGMAVALFGTSVLAGTALTGFHQMRASSSSSSSSDSGWSSDSSSDGGCGGSSGCGGCGGD